MPSLVGVVGTDGTVNTGVAANYLKAKASTQFGTRQLSVLTLTVATSSLTDGGTPDEYLAPNSNYSKVVRALQQTAEVWAVFAPVENSSSDDSFNVIIATDTQWPGAVQDRTVLGGTGGDATTYDGLEAALLAGSGLTVTVTAPAGFVAPFHG